MGVITARFSDFWRDESGAAAAEYAILLAAIVVIAAVAADNLGDTMAVVLDGAADCVEVGCVETVTDD